MITLYGGGHMLQMLRPVAVTIRRLAVRPGGGELSQDANLNLGLGHIWVTFGQHLGYI